MGVNQVLASVLFRIEKSLADQGLPKRTNRISEACRGAGLCRSLCRFYVGELKVIALEQKGLTGGLRQSVGEAIAQVQPCRVVAFAEPPAHRRSLGKPTFVIQEIAVLDRRRPVP